MSDDDEAEDWEQGDVLTEASNLIDSIKDYFSNNRNNMSMGMLRSYKKDIETYLQEINSQDFSPRPDRLTKEGVKESLNDLLRDINRMLSTSGGKSKSKRRKSKRSKSKRRKTKRRKRRSH